MPAFSHVLHPTDLSPDGNVAFAHGLRIALAAKGRCTIVHTIDTAAAGNEWRLFPKVRERLVQWGVLPEGASEEDVAALGLGVTKADLRVADTRKGICAYAERHGCDLMVLSTHARQGAQRWLSANVAEPLARTIQAPTLFIPEGSAGFIDAHTGEARLRNILVPVDLSPDPGRAVEIAVGLAQLLEAKGVVVTLLHVGPSMDAPPLQPPEGIDLRWMQRQGPVIETILEVAEETQADLVAMTTHGHDGFLDALRGSTTEQVLRRANRALLAAPEYLRRGV